MDRFNTFKTCQASFKLVLDCEHNLEASRLIYVLPFMTM